MGEVVNSLINNGVVNAVNEAVNNVASSTLKGVLGYTDKKLVSCDFNHDPRSSIFVS